MSALRWRGLALELWLPALLVLLWWLSSRGSTSLYFPPLAQILDRFASDWLFARVGSDLLPSLRNLAAGFAIGAGLGVALGVALGLSPLARLALPLLEVMRAVPVIALIPLVIMLMGTGDGEKIAIIAFGTLWPVLLNTTEGVRMIDPTLRDATATMGLRKRDTLMRVVLPAASPQIFAGLRLAVSIALVATVGSELFASTRGIGYVILSATQGWDMPQMWAALIMLGIIGYALNGLMSLAERRALGWHHSHAASGFDSSHRRER
ncbi:ABC transporter permease [Bosea sp. FBZP-16]|uniref:ABC transporter permease n=1 Tax=Bosea sp. FBZP-16 TaxID=2065382 RepID=UPI00131A2906|nr:ABC transporter permease [Bosea sp. FBZP-16]